MSDTLSNENPEQPADEPGSCAPPCSRLVDLCRELIGHLEAVEESDLGREFHPTKISSCRSSVANRLSEIIPEIKAICNLGSGRHPAREVLLQELENIASASPRQWGMTLEEFQEDFQPWAQSRALKAISGENSREQAQP